MIEEGWDLEKTKEFDHYGRRENREMHVPMSRDERINRGYAHWVGAWVDPEPGTRRPREYYDREWEQWHSWWWDYERKWG